MLDSQTPGQFQTIPTVQLWVGKHRGQPILLERGKNSVLLISVDAGAPQTRTITEDTPTGTPTLVSVNAILSIIESIADGGTGTPTLVSLRNQQAITETVTDGSTGAPTLVSLYNALAPNEHVTDATTGAPTLVSLNNDTLLQQLAAYWTMNQATGATRLDSTANHLDLSDLNTNIAQVGGVISFAAQLSQSAPSNALQAGANALFVMGSGVSFTFSGWFQGAGYIIGRPIFCMTDGVTTTPYLFQVDGTATNLQWYCEDLSNAGHTNNVTAVTSGTWQYITLGYDDSVKKQFWQVNAGTRQFGSAISGVSGASHDFDIGNYGTLLALPNQFIIDEFGFWRRALTTAEVTQLYNSGAGLSYPFH